MLLIATRQCSGYLAGGIRALGNLGEEIVVRAGRLEPVNQQFQPRGFATLGGQAVEHPAQTPYLLEGLRAEEQLLVTRGRTVDVDRRVKTALGQAPVELELHVAGA